ncbi:hypothetical protein BV898_17845 [Hypsibius exemplaris]|uniref:ERAP1-like C-terminal domain-containing protein n=1 Tax=Hypsibius exemplaris TaxID=2072580 RepID=A0A9X6NFU1_HYPEX|nr:hypothetical protein BV898_17845 [Hypsibius exemplaris]
MREGKPSYWKFMKELLVVPGTITTSKLSLLRGMACSRDESQLHEVLMAAIDPDIVRSQDENAVFGYLNKFNEAHVMTWEFVQREWSNPLLTNRANVVATFGSSLKTKWRIDQLKALFERAKGGKDAKDIPEGATFVRAIERAEINRLWVEKHGGNIAALVSQLTPGTDIPPTA